MGASFRMRSSPLATGFNFTAMGSPDAAAVVMLASHACVYRGSLCCQRRHSGTLSKLLQDGSDPYLLPIQEMDLQRIAEIALTKKTDPQHLWDGLIAINATLRMQVEDRAATKDDLDAAFAVYTEAMRYAPTAVATSVPVGSDGDVHSKCLPEDVWQAEWDGPLQEFRIIFRTTGDKRLP